MIEFTKFTEKLNSSELVSKAWDEIDRDQASAGLLIDTISNEFKDWQPPKPLVVVPKIVADYIEDRKESLKLYGAFHEIYECYCGDLYNWVFQKSNGQDLFARAWIDGYTVEKEKKYILKHIDLSEQDNVVSLYLAHSQNGKLQHERFSKDVDMSKIERCHFTQSEIDKLNIGSYEQIPVEMSDNGI